MVALARDPLEVRMSAVKEEQDLFIILTRLEGKVDTSLAIQGGDIANLKGADTDKELRLRALESRSTVTVGQLWTGLLGAVGAAAGLATFLKTVFPS